MKKRILISTSSFNIKDNIPLSRLQHEGFEIVINPYGRRLTEAEVSGLLEQGVVGMIAGVEPLTRDVLAAAKSLKVISRCGIGMDSVDLDAARELGIQVDNTPAGPVVAVAELTLAIILALLRKVVQADRNIREGNWKPLMGNLLACQTVGIIGYGRIGKKVGVLVRSFGAKTIAFDKRDLPEAPDVEFCSLNDVFQQADIVSMHVPYNASTHHLVSHEKISLMKPGSMLINTSRGGVVDEQSLQSALQSKHLAGAGLDAFEEEPYHGPLASLPQVVLTAHMGSYAREARMKMELDASENLVKGLIAKGLVNAHIIGGEEALQHG